MPYTYGTHVRPQVSNSNTLRALAAWLSQHGGKGAGTGGADRINAEPPATFKRTLAQVHARDNFLRNHPEVSERRPARNVGMRSAHIMAPIFASNKGANPRMSQLMLAGGVFGLMLENIAWLRVHPETPDLYSAGVSYKPERRRIDPRTGKPSEYGEEWQTIPWVIYRGYGDCEDLGAWRSAELNAKYHIKAHPYIKMRRMPDGFWRAHVVVRWPDGQIEDPSAKLGMYTFTY
jgi:hypothetical protein